MALSKAFRPFTLICCKPSMKSPNSAMLVSLANKRAGPRLKLQYRDYSYRVYGRSRLSAFDSIDPNHVVYGIIAANLAVWGAWQSPDLVDPYFMSRHFTCMPAAIGRGTDLHTLVTSVFSHQDNWHLGSNMFTLFFFGTSAATVLGARAFLTLYLTGGVLSSACQSAWGLFGPSMGLPSSFWTSPYQRGLGASGAINAVVAWTILRFPSQVVMLYGIIPMPAILFGAAFIGKDAYELYYGLSGKGNAAHLSGAFWGAMYYLLRR